MEERYTETTFQFGNKLLIHIPTLKEKIKKKGTGNMFDKPTLELFIKLGIKRITKRNQPLKMKI